MNDTTTLSPSPADMQGTAPAAPPPTRLSLSPDALQRQTIRDLITGTALKLATSAEIDLDALEVLAKLLDAQTRSQEANVRRWQFLDSKRQREEFEPLTRPPQKAP